MKVTQEADYAMRIVLHLTKLGKDQHVDAKTLSEKEGIPTRFAVKILRKLTLQGLTRAYRGVNGGYALNRSPENITLHEVIEAIDGPICVNRCTYDKNFCNLRRSHRCPVHAALAEVREVLVRKLESINFKQLGK